jgi:hypothetical protein
MLFQIVSKILINNQSQYVQQVNNNDKTIHYTTRQ